MPFRFPSVTWVPLGHSGASQVRSKLGVRVRFLGPWVSVRRPCMASVASPVVLGVRGLIDDVIATECDTEGASVTK